MSSRRTLISGKLCPAYSYVSSPCNTTHDATCECDRNYFWHVETTSCRKCTLCEVGYGAKRACGARRDTHCSVCPTVSHVTSRYVRSRHCSVCPTVSRHVTLRQVRSRYVRSRHCSVCSTVSRHVTLRQVTSLQRLFHGESSRHVTSGHVTAASAPR